MRLLQLLLIVGIFGVIFAALFGGGGFLLARNVPMIIEGRQSRTWPTAVGTVKESAAMSKPIITSSRRGTVGTHVVAVRYEFVAGGQVFTGTRQSLDDVGIIKTEEEAQRQARSMPPGSSVRVSYDAGDPSRSLLTPGLSISSLITSVMGLILIATGLGFIAAALYLRSHHLKRRARRGDRG